MAKAKAASAPAYDYNVTNLTTSYREDIVSDTQVKCYLVAHVTYEYGTYKQLGSCDNDIMLIATKDYDTDGNATTTVSTEQIPDQSTVLSQMKSIIESKIASEIQEEIYQNQIRKVIGTAGTTINFQK